MAKRKRPDQQEENILVSSEDSLEQAPEEIEEPLAPKGMTDEEAQDLKSRSVNLVKQLEDASGSKELELIDNVTSVGIVGTAFQILRSF